MTEHGPADRDLAERLRASVLDLLARRAATSTICPSDAARAVGGETWRDAMPLAREVAARLADEGVVEVRQRGERVDVCTARGPVRIARAGGFDAACETGIRHPGQAAVMSPVRGAPSRRA